MASFETAEVSAHGGSLMRCLDIKVMALTRLIAGSLISFLCLGVLGEIFALADETQSARFRVSHSVPSGLPIARLIEDWRDEIDRGARNNIDVVIYSGGQLYGPGQQLLAVAQGHIQGAFVHSSYLARVVPLVSVLSWPYAVANRRCEESSAPLMDSRLGAYIQEKLEEKNLKILSWLVLSENVGISSSGSSLATPANFRGRKIRSTGPIVGSILAATGASPVSLGGAEVYQALQTNMVDGALTTLRSIYMRRYYEVNDWVTVTPVFPGYFAIIVNRRWWKNLPDDDRRAISAASRGAERPALSLTRRLEAETPELLRARGMSVHVHSDEEIAGLRSLMKPAWMATFLDLAGENGTAALHLAEEWLGECADSRGSP